VTTVFLGGSRAVSKLNGVIREQLDNLIDRGCSILIGDANGADKAMQGYFAQRNYSNVVVFCMGRPRNNVGSWPTHVISSDRTTKDREYYSVKDRVMSRDARCGLMLWDGESKGTLANISNLISERKRVLVYLSLVKKFYTLSSEEDLDALLGQCNGKVSSVLKRNTQLRLGHP
jgi:hypothetical protein